MGDNADLFVCVRAKRERDGKSVPGNKPRRPNKCTNNISASSQRVCLVSQMPMPVALPSNATQRYHLDPNATTAYNVCLGFEENAKCSNDLMNARILGYLIIYSPSVSARHELVKVIHSCRNDHASLSALGATFLDYYIRPCEQSAHTLSITR